MYRVIIAPKAKRQLRAIKKTYLESIASAVEEIKDYPHIGKLLNDELAGRRSLRIGVFRIIYTVNEKDERITIHSAGHRSIVYQ